MKDQAKFKMQNNILIGDGPLFNHCVNLINLNKQNFLLITPKKNKKMLNIKKKFFINFSQLKRIKKINYLISIMNGKIISKEILNKTKKAINFHDGPLPKYAGLFSSTWAIINNEKNHGCCWHIMNEKIDCGDIISFKNFKISKMDTAYSVDLKSLYYGYEMFEKKILKMIKSNRFLIKKKNSIVKSYFGKKNLEKISDLCILKLKKSLVESDKIFRALKVSKEKMNSIIKPKILTSKGYKFVTKFSKIKCINSKKTFHLHERIFVKKNSFCIKKKNECYNLEIQKQKNEFFYLR